jgi:N6-adenosine-specific RNA methylase IME4
MAELNLPLADNVMLFLWTLNINLKHSLLVMKNWGLEYKTNMAWVKGKEEFELLFIGKKGDVPVPEPANKPSSILISEGGGHNERPQIIHEIIEKMYPNRRYLEVYPNHYDTDLSPTEEHRGNWTLWGIGDHIQTRKREGQELDPALFSPPIKAPIVHGEN